MVKRRLLETKGDFLRQQRTLKLRQPKQFKKEKDMLQLWQYKHKCRLKKKT